MRSRASHLLASIGAVAAGAILIVVLSIGADVALEAIGALPSLQAPFPDEQLYLLPLAYRCIFSSLGAYVAARLAPHAPMAHALALGAFGATLAALGLVAAMSADMGPLWYPVALLFSCLPTAWLGGFLARRQSRNAA